MPKKLVLKIQNLENMLDIEGGGGIAILYIGYVEVQLQTPDIKNYKENDLMMVMNNSRYGDKIPFAIGTIHIYTHHIKEMTKDEWDNMTLSCASKVQGWKTSV